MSFHELDVTLLCRAISVVGQPLEMKRSGLAHISFRRPLEQWP